MREQSARVVQVRVSQGATWHAYDDDGEQVAVAESLAELRRRVIRAVEARADLDQLVRIEWIYPLANGEVHVEHQDVVGLRPGRPAGTTGPLGWHQRRVDEYIRRRRDREQPQP